MAKPRFKLYNYLALYIYNIHFLYHNYYEDYLLVFVFVYYHLALYYIKNHLDLYDLFAVLSIIYPKYLLKSKINEKKIINNKYISKSLIYISNERFLYNNNLNKDIIYLINKLKGDEEFINFMKENYNCENEKLKKVMNVYEKIIKFE